MNWQIGDRAIVDYQKSEHHEQETIITAINVGGIDRVTGPFIGHEVDLPCTSSKYHDRCIFMPKYLKPILDSNELTTWESVREITDWQPKELVT